MKEFKETGKKSEDVVRRFKRNGQEQFHEKGSERLNLSLKKPIHKLRVVHKIHVDRMTENCYIGAYLIKKRDLLD